jgi:tRNA(Ile)-lysidine synthase
MFGRGTSALVGCSGGPDSVCLLYSLWHLRRLLGIRLEVFHFDHRLRPDSSKDASYARRLAGRLGLPFHLREAADAPAAGASVEVWARHARLAAAREVLAGTGAERLALGHTLDDQAETVLLGLVLGWGPEGLAGMTPASGGLVRPLLEVTRAEVEDFCRALRLRPRRDPSNRDPRFLRNAIRLEVIPALERATGRNVRTTIARSAELVRSDLQSRWREADAAAARLVEPTPTGCRIAVDELMALPREVAARVVRHAILSIGGTLTLADVEALLDLGAGRPGRRRDLASGSTARRDRVYLSLSRTSPEIRV